MHRYKHYIYRSMSAIYRYRNWDGVHIYIPVQSQMSNSLDNLWCTFVILINDHTKFTSGIMEHASLSWLAYYQMLWYVCWPGPMHGSSKLWPRGSNVLAKTKSMLIHDGNVSVSLLDADHRPPCSHGLHHLHCTWSMVLVLSNNFKPNPPLWVGFG